MLEDIEGIVISEQDFKESSKIINLYTKKYGIIGLIAKGAKNLKSPLRSTTTKLSYGVFTVYYKEGKLSLLKEVNIKNNFKNIFKDINKISFATYLVELACQVYKESENNTVYDILIAGLNKINDNFDPIVIVNIIELKYLEYLGVLPVIDRCSSCGKQTNIITLSADTGGYLCKSCYTNEPIISEAAIKLIRMYYYVDIEKIENLNIKKQYKEEINNFLDLYYERYTGMYLKSKRILNSLIN